jgi:hypothetical protein
MPTLQSPNVNNYAVGKGVLLAKKEGDTLYRYMGNVTAMELSPTLETLDHFSAMAGIKSKDKTVILSAGGELVITMEELTADNLALFLLSDVDMTDPDMPVLDIFSEDLVSAAVKYIGTNEIGPRWLMEFNKVDFVPSGTFNPISDEWASLEVTGQLATSGGSFGSATLINLVDGLDPVNYGLPAVIGRAVVGETVTAFEGVWVGDPTGYAYQWRKDGVDIGGATSSTYVLLVGDIGADITVEVTATNAAGSTNAYSPATQFGPIVAATT